MIQHFILVKFQCFLLSPIKSWRGTNPWLQNERFVSMKAWDGSYVSIPPRPKLAVHKLSKRITLEAGLQSSPGYVVDLRQRCFCLMGRTSWFDICFALKKTCKTEWYFECIRGFFCWTTGTRGSPETQLGEAVWYEDGGSADWSQFDRRQILALEQCHPMTGSLWFVFGVS